MRLTIEWINRPEFTQFLARMGDSPHGTSQLITAVGRAAIRLQKEMRQNLEAMVYSQPPAASGYVRTRTLMRSTHAAKPSSDHSGDEGKALGGMDLAATAPRQVAEKIGNQIVSEVGSWISYAEHVHAGDNQPSPRPFVAAAENEAERILEDEVSKAVQRMAAGK